MGDPGTSRAADASKNRWARLVLGGALVVGASWLTLPVAYAATEPGPSNPVVVETDPEPSDSSPSDGLEPPETGAEVPTATATATATDDGDQPGGDPTQPTEEQSGGGDGEAVLPTIPPASATPVVSGITVAIALVMLVLCGVVLLWRIRAETSRGLSTQAVRAVSAVKPPSALLTSASDAPPPDALPPDALPPDAPTTTAVLGVLASAGEAMLDAGHTVMAVRDALLTIAHTAGLADAEVVVMPTALFVSVPSGGEVLTAAIASGHRPLTLAQTDAIDDAVDDAKRGTVIPTRTTALIESIRAMPEPYSGLQRVAGYVLISVALAVLLGGSWADVAVAGLVGAGVGTALVVGKGVSADFAVVVMVGAALTSAMVTFLLARTPLDLGVLPALVAPLVLFLPGGLLTTAVIELSAGQMISGAGRLAAGAMKLVLLALGIVAAAALVGLPAIELSTAQQPLGPLAPWIAVAVFGAGVVIFQCGRRRSVAWIVLVLYVTYGAQVLSSALVGGVLSAFIGALVMTPVAGAVARQPSGPAMIVTFLPAFWLLVPGTLGLVGVTALLDGDSTGFHTLITTTATMVAIALGVLVGTALVGWLHRDTASSPATAQTP